MWLNQATWHLAVSLTHCHRCESSRPTNHLPQPVATEGIPPNESKNLECPRNVCIRNLEVVGSQFQPQVVYNMCFMRFILTNRSTSWFQMDHIYLNRRMFIHIFPFGSPTPKSLKSRPSPPKTSFSKVSKEVGPSGRTVK